MSHHHLFLSGLLSPHHLDSVLSSLIFLLFECALEPSNIPAGAPYNPASFRVHQELFGVFPFFLSKKKTSMTPCFHKDFWKIKVLIQNKNQIGVCSKKQVLKIQVIS
jgi:hypothetical protein